MIKELLYVFICRMLYIALSKMMEMKSKEEKMSRIERTQQRSPCQVLHYEKDLNDFIPIRFFMSCMMQARLVLPMHCDGSVEDVVVMQHHSTSSHERPERLHVLPPCTLPVPLQHLQGR